MTSSIINDHWQQMRHHKWVLFRISCMQDFIHSQIFNRPPWQKSLFCKHILKCEISQVLEPPVISENWQLGNGCRLICRQLREDEVQNQHSSILDFKTVYLLSSYNSQVLTLTHQLQTATPYKILYWMPSVEAPGLSSLERWGFIFVSTFNMCANPFIHNLWTLPCLLWFQYPAVLWPHAAHLNLVLPEKMDKKYYILCADMRWEMGRKNEVKNNKVMHFITFFHCIEKAMIYIWMLLSFTFCSIGNSSSNKYNK